jgi:hypothetical protein
MQQHHCFDYHKVGVAMSKYKQSPPRGASQEERAKYFIEKAKKIHGSTYDYSLVLSTFTRQQNPVTLICSKHGEFTQLASNHLAGKGCRKCAKAQVNAIRYKTQYELAQDSIKICGSCNLPQPFENFSPEPKGRKIGKVGSWCKKCCGLKNQTKYKNRIRKANLKKYNLTPDDYCYLLTKQNHRCQICKIPEAHAPGVGKGVGILCVDHDHETGKVRGLLCSRCNTGLGLFFDDISNLQNAITYLNSNADQSGKT